METNCEGDRSELSRVVLQPNGDALEDRMEGKSQKQHECPEGSVLKLLKIMRMMMVTIMRVIWLARDFVVIMVMDMMVVVSGGLVGYSIMTNTGQQWLPLLLLVPLLHMMDPLLYQQHQGKPNKHDELSGGKPGQVQVVQGLNLRHNLGHLLHDVYLEVHEASTQEDTT